MTGWILDNGMDNWADDHTDNGAVVILFLSNHNIHKSLHGLFFWASDPLIDRFFKNLSIKESEDQKHRPHELL